MIARYFAGTSTPEEKRAIIEWYNDDPANKKKLNELKEIWTITGTVPKDINPDIQAAWQNVSAKIDDYEKIMSKRGKKFSFYLSRVAAVFVLGVVLYLIFYLSGGSQLSFEKIASAGTREEVILSDGSRVWLNTYTTLEYVKDFEGDARLVKLNGEAFFDVTKNKEKPFVVETNISRVKVLGTSFNYKAYSSKDENILTVNSGRVEFSSIDNNRSVILVENEKAELSSKTKSIAKTLNTDKNYSAWKTGKLIFENETLAKIINDISEHYSRSFEFGNEKIKSARLTVTFHNKQLEDVLKILSITLNVSFRENGDKYIIN
jgi:ferric-dicitrate binding protein FerR (iron transport regulator)